MTTATEAINAIAPIVQLPASAVGVVARRMREHDGEMWPQGGFGGGKNAARVNAHHLVNLVLGLAVADTVSEVGVRTEAYAQMERLSEPFTTEAAEIFRDIWNETWFLEFSEAIACLLPRIASDQESVVGFWGIEVEAGQFPNGQPYGEIFLLSGAEPTSRVKLGLYIGSDRIPGRSLRAFRRTVCIPADLFLTISRIEADDFVLAE